ncbi:HlyD family secretion protein [Bacteroides sp. KG123]|uniref:HlyD family secretion protein n=1 Tax=unclassified Bacteroides TaxID=2646097 RepID=UPI003D7F5E99
MLLLFLSACSGSTSEYDATGTFEATEVVVSAEASGKLLSFDIEEGSMLKSGQEVGIIDTVQLYLKKLQLEAGIKSVEGQRPDILKQVAAIEEQIVQAKRERERVANLLRVGAANRKQLDDAESLLEVLRKQLAAHNSTLRNSERSLTWQSSSVGIQVAQVEDQLKKCHIISPLTGTVLAKYAEAGELAVPGRPLFKVADMEQIFLRAYITSKQLAEVRLGQKVAVYSDYGKDVRKEYSGVVTWISDTSEFTPKTILTKDERANLVYAVKIAVRNDGMLKIGMYGGVEF